MDSVDHLIWALGSLCALQRVPFSADVARQQFPPPYGRQTLVAAAPRLGLAVNTVSVQQAIASRGFGSDPQRMPSYIAFAKRRMGDASTERTGPDDSVEPVTLTLSEAFVLVGKIENERVVYFLPGTDQPHIIGLTEFQHAIEPQLLGFVRVPEGTPNGRAEDGERDDGAFRDVAASRTFGFGWFARELLKHRRIWRDVVVASLAIQLMALGTPLFTQVVIDKVVVHRTESTLIAVGVGLALFMVFSAILTWVRQYLVLHTGNRVDAALGSEVFAHLLHLPQRYFESRSTGVIAARLHGVETIREFIASAAVSLVLDLPFLAIFLGMMFWYSALLTWIALAIIVVIAAMSAAVAPLFRARLNQQFLLGARNQAFVTEFVAGMETVKSLQMEPQLALTYRDYLASYLEAGFRMKQVGNTYNVFANALEQMMTLAILLVGAWVVMTSPGFSIGMLVAFQMLSGRVSQPILRLVGLWQQFQQANIAVKRLGDVLDAPREPHSVVPSRAAPQGRNGARIAIQSLGFRYGPHLPFLYEDLNLTIEPGQTVAFTGPSGCGKSTLTKLLQAFYLPTQGAIRIDGVDITNLPANELRSYFGVVPQETMLFSGTIYQNLLYADPNATFDEIVHAAKMAEIHEAIELLPEGYQTEIGERGVGLSGGQKQRIAIARALLKRPRVLIFDEATANLDVATAAHIAETVNRLGRGSTILFISHAVPERLRVDRKFVFDEGGARPARAFDGASVTTP